MDTAGGHAQIFQHLAGVLIRQTRGVVVAAQMTQEEIPQTRVHEAPDGVAAIIVGEVAGALADAHLQIMRIGAAEEHVHVEVGFHHDGLGLGGPVPSW